MPTTQESPKPESDQVVNEPPKPAEEPKKSRRPVVMAVLGVLILLGLVFGVRYYLWSAGHVSTDDAQIASDVVQVNPQVSGTVDKVLVAENEVVKPGQLLVQLNSDTYRIAVENAKANLDLALAQLQSAKATTALTSRNVSAQIQQAQGVVQQSSGGVGVAQAEVQRAQAAQGVSEAQAATARANVSGANSAYRIAQATLRRAQGAYAGAQAAVSAAQSAVATAQADQTASEASAASAERQARRMQNLFAQGVVSGQAYDQALSAAQVARSQANSVGQRIAEAQSVVQQRRADLQQAQSQIASSRAAVTQSQAAILAAQGQASASQDLIQQAIAQRNSAAQNVAVAQAKGSQASGQLAQANTAPEQLAVSKRNEQQAQAKVEQARAALREAEINLARTKIYAPTGGRVSRKTIELGQSVSTGAPLMSIVESETPWVAANFKETQLVDVRPGQPVEIEVDAFAGRNFKGHVDSMSAGTGATFALLPPDNSTGNFTKVVQRVPVKIVFQPNQERLSDLRIGMSAVVTIATK